MENFQIKGAPTCRIIYPDGMFRKSKPKNVPNARETHNCWVLIPKNDAEKVTQINEKYAEAFDDLKKRGFKGKVPAAIDPKNNCLLSGEDLFNSKDNVPEELKDYFIIKTSSNFPPVVVDTNKRVILNGLPAGELAAERISPVTFKDGDYVFANIQFWTYANSGEGIGCNLNAVVWVKEGTTIGGSAVSDNVDDLIDFADYV